ncbi:hypothetical protein ABF162_05430 [Vibrio coralliilyticus]|uniref:hypothetical protein n=1 Tax=Vibrio coralliilyticus TaxID=190893 RepID=UPI000AB25386|nr:hypothetical protein [Vibrio coralliilyticus]
MNQMTSAIIEVAQSTNVAMLTANKAHEQTTEGTEIVNEAIHSIEILANEINVVSEWVSQLSEEKPVDYIIQGIDAIKKYTSLISELPHNSISGFVDLVRTVGLNINTSNQ